MFGEESAHAASWGGGGGARTDIRVFVSACLLKQATSLWDSPLSSVVFKRDTAAFLSFFLYFLPLSDRTCFGLPGLFSHNPPWQCGLPNPVPSPQGDALERDGASFLRWLSLPAFKACFMSVGACCRCPPSLPLFAGWGGGGFRLCPERVGVDPSGASDGHQSPPSVR